MFQRSPVSRKWGWWIAVSVLVVVVVLVITLARRVGAGTGSDQTPAPAPAPISTTAATARVLASTTPAPSTASGTPVLPGVAPDDSALVGGFTNHLEFARKVASVLLAYDAGTDFAARNADLLRAAAPTPYGDPTGLADALAAYTPTGTGLDSIRATGTSVTVAVTGVAVSDWATRRLAARGVGSGVYGIDITATQTMTGRGAPPVRVPVRMGVTVACPPAVAFCTLAGVFPQFVQHALGAG